MATKTDNATIDITYTIDKDDATSYTTSSTRLYVKSTDSTFNKYADIIVLPVAGVSDGLVTYSAVPLDVGLNKMEIYFLTFAGLVTMHFKADEAVIRNPVSPTVVNID